MRPSSGFRPLLRLRELAEALYPAGLREPRPAHVESGPARVRAKAVTLAVAALALAIWLVPCLFDDPEAARRGMAALLVGLAAVALAVFNGRRMAIDKRGPASTRRPAAAQTATDDDAKKSSLEPGLRLGGVDLRDAILPGVDLKRADLNAALLDHTDLRKATMKGSSLAGAKLRNADLREADLDGADLCGTSLAGASLEGASLEGAIYDEYTVWPADAPSPEEMGAVRVGARK